MRQSDPVFDRLYNGIHYGGSYFDGLAVGNLRHEFDLNIIFKVGFKLKIIDLSDRFMKHLLNTCRYLRLNSR